MTTTSIRAGADRTAATGPGAGRAPSRAWAAGLRAAAAASLLGLAAVVALGLLVWATDERSSAGAAQTLRTLASVWLYAHGASLALPDGRLSLVPIGLCAVPFLLVVRTTATAARQCLTATPPAVAGLALAVALPYTAIAAVVALLASSDAVRAPLPSTLASVATLSLAAALLGACVPSRLWRSMPAPAASRWWPALRAHGAATALLLATGSLLAGSSLALHLPRAVDVSQSIAPGPVGASVLALLGLSLVPNAVVFGVAWLSGGGFVVGTDTLVSAGQVQLGPLPAVPLLAAAPAGAVPGWLAVCSVAAPVLAGVLAGVVLHGRERSRLDRLLGLAVLAALTALTWAVFAWLTGGAVGGGRLSEIGAPPLRTAALLTAEVTLGAALALLALLLLARRGERPGESID